MKKFKSFNLIIFLIITLTYCKKTVNIPEGIFFGYIYKMENERINEYLGQLIIKKDTIYVYEGEKLVYSNKIKVSSNDDSLINLITPEYYVFTYNKNLNKFRVGGAFVENFSYLTEISFFTEDSFLTNKVNEFPEVQLITNISHLSNNEKKMLSILFDVADIMDKLYWKQICPNKDSILSLITNEKIKKLFFINYGPYEKLRNNTPFIKGVPPYNPKQTFYPKDLTKEEFDIWNNKEKLNWYTIIRRNEKNQLIAIPYSEYYKEDLSKAAKLLREAAEFSENQTFKKYLLERAKSFETNNYFNSDMAWMDVKENNIEFVVGPIENYDDEFLGLKTSFESFILIKDKDWTEKLKHIINHLQKIQEALPVPDQYKKEKPGLKSDIGVYDAIYYAGDCNAGSKSIAINLPNDKKVNELKGSRKLMLKNSMKAKFDKILTKIAKCIYINEELINKVTFDAFFQNVMFHEIAHGLGISKTIKSNILVTEALKEYNSIIEEAKADILGLYALTYLSENNFIQDINLENNYITFITNIFRSIRFGLASAHGKANAIIFNYFVEKGVIKFDPKFNINIDLTNIKDVIKELTSTILILQGDGDYEKVKQFVNMYSKIDYNLLITLIKIAENNIPRDIHFIQGKHLFKELQEV